MYLEYKRRDGVEESLVYREVGDIVQVATYGDFRCGYITFTKEDFEKIFLSRATKVLKHKPRMTREELK
jgi:hypothetical protein